MKCGESTAVQEASLTSGGGGMDSAMDGWQRPSLAQRTYIQSAPITKPAGGSQIHYPVYLEVEPAS